MSTSKLALSPSRFDAVIFDLDGVVTKTERLHAAVWKRLFDEFLRDRSAATKTPFEPLDAERDYLETIDGKPRYDGVKSFLDLRGVHLDWGSPADSRRPVRAPGPRSPPVRVPTR